MRSVKVKWCEEDLKCAISDLGFEPTRKNIKAIKDNRVRKAMENAMLMAGWNAMKDVIIDTLLHTVENTK